MWISKILLITNIPLQLLFDNFSFVLLYFQENLSFASSRLSNLTNM
jgi:hypothetical protein